MSFEVLIILDIFIFSLFNHSHKEDILIFKSKVLNHTRMVGLYHITIIMYFLNIVDTLVNPLIMVLKLGVEYSPPLAMEFQQVQSQFAQIIDVL